MRLVTYRIESDDAGILGVLHQDYVVDVAGLADGFGELLPDTMLGLIDAGPTALQLLQSLLKRADADGFPFGVAVFVENTTFLAPIPRPRKNVFGIGLNYVEHVEESSRTLDTSKELPEKPVVFSKPPTAIIANNEPILHNKNMTKQLDWEVELAVIIGRKATKIDKGNALKHVFGYSVINDISARDNRRAGQWIFSKGQDSFAPFGPMIVTADEITDPHNLNLSLKVNGVEKQNSNTKHMLFKIDHLIWDLSQGITLEPGDVIATGTPSGVGAGREPQEWMVPGDVVEATVEKIGTLRNPIVDISEQS